MLKVGVPRFTRVPQLLVYNLNKEIKNKTVYIAFKRSYTVFV